MKKRLSMFLALLLLLPMLLPLGASAQEPERILLDSREAFLAFAEACCEESYSLGRVFELSCDIDLLGTDFEPIPYFAGTLEGNGHTVRGLRLSQAGSRMGLFRRTGPQAVIRQLNAVGEVQPSGTQSAVGGLVGENAGSLVSCSFSGEVSGIADVGGLVGRNTPSGRVSDCSFGGSVTGEHQVGGIAGKNEGSLVNCRNIGAVNTVEVTPVGELHFDLSALSQDDFLNLSNIGGVTGENLGAVLRCRNDAEVGYRIDGYNVGGIAGKSAGFLQSCENSGSIHGRRDVGGICGQLIPYATWDLSEGRLDDLAGSVRGLQALLNVLSADSAEASGTVADELLQMQTDTAALLDSLSRMLDEYEQSDQSLIDSIWFDPETGEIRYDESALSFADRTELNEALINLEGQGMVLTQQASGAFGTIAYDLGRVSNQMAIVFDKLLGTVDSMGTLQSQTVDLSATQTYDHNEGAIEACVNRGEVSAENHAGGIAGTVGFELEFDMEDRLDASRVLVSDAKRYLFAAVRVCESYGAVTAREEGAGCVAAAVDVGCLSDCVGLGEARSQAGDYVGGIVGRSLGMVRACWSRADLSGRRYVGGIAGLGTDLKGCRSWPHIEGAEEYQGAVAGWTEGTVENNLYIPGPPAGVDGVSLIGQCRPVSEDELLKEDTVPKDFASITLRFVAEGKLIRTEQIPFGGRLESLPEVPNRDVRYWKWDDFDQEHLYYSRTVEGKYYAPNSTLSTGGEIPLLLAEGLFYEGQSLTAAEREAQVEGQERVGAWTVSVNDYEGELTLRLYAPEGGQLYRLEPDGSTARLDARRDGSYLVFSLPNNGTVILTRPDAGRDWRPLIVGVGVVWAVVGLLLLQVRKKKKPRTPVQAETSTGPETPAQAEALNEPEIQVQTETDDKSGKE